MFLLSGFSLRPRWRVPSTGTSTVPCSRVRDALQLQDRRAGRSRYPYRTCPSKARHEIPGTRYGYRDVVTRIALQLQQQHAEYGEIRRAVVDCEELGVDIVYNWDHFFPLSGDSEGKHFEAWTMLASWAEITERVEIGSLVTCNSYRNPHLLADMARTIDHISGGRLILGIGSGWFRKDYEEYGYEFGTAPGRLRNLDRDVPIIKTRLSHLNPPPVRPIPILVGGGGEKVTLRIAAQHADIWHTFATPARMDVWVHKNNVLNDWCAKVGRDPSEIERSVGVSTRRIDFAEELAAAGAGQITLELSGPHYDLGIVRDWLAWRDER